MDAKIIAAVIGVLGISLGALFSGAGYYYKVRAEHLATNKKILYYLLQIRYSIKTQFIDPSEFKSAYLAYFNNFSEKAGINSDASIPNDVDVLLDQFFNKLVENIKPEMGGEILKPFNEELEKLSGNNPVLAYKLEGKEIISKLIQLQNEYAKAFSSLDTIKQSSELISIIDSQMKIAKNNNYKELVKLTNSDIRRVALSCGIVTYLQCVLLMSKKLEPEYDFSKLGLEQMFENFAN